jgi:lysophospholipase L1-like esterase
MVPTITDNEFASLVASYGAGLSMNDMRRKKWAGDLTTSMNDLEKKYYPANDTWSLSEEQRNAYSGNGSLSDNKNTFFANPTPTVINIATNPGYESGTNSFASSNTGLYVPTTESTAPLFGTKSLLTTRASTLSNIISAVLLTSGASASRTPCTAGQAIFGAVTVKTEVYNARIATSWFWYDAASGLTQGTETTRYSNVTPNTLYRVSEVGIPPAGTVTCIFVVRVYTNSGNCAVGDKVWFDQLMIVDNYSGAELAYNDGNSLGWTWAGTADASTSSGPGRLKSTAMIFSNQASCDILATNLPTFTITVQSTTTIAGGVLTAPTGTFKYRGAAGFAYGTPFPLTTVYAPNSRYPGAYATPNNCGESFMFTGTEFEVLYYFVNTAGSIRMRIDGKRIANLPVVTTGVSAGSRFVWKVTFGAAVTNKRIDLDHNHHHFGGVFVAPGNTVAAVPNLSTRCLLFGDSITNGSNSTTGLANGTWKQLFDKYCNIDDIWDIAIGGTGYCNRGASPGTTTEALTARLADFQNFSPNILITWAGYNDFSFIDSDFRTGVQTVLSAVAAQPNTVEKYVWGHWSPTVAQGATYARHDQILREEAAARALPIWMPATGICYNKSGVQVGTVQPIIRDVTDVTNFIQADAVHPTDAGNTRIAQVAQSAMMLLAA